MISNMKNLVDGKQGRYVNEAKQFVKMSLRTELGKQIAKRLLIEFNSLIPEGDLPPYPAACLYADERTRPWALAMQEKKETNFHTHSIDEVFFCYIKSELMEINKFDSATIPIDLSVELNPSKDDVDFDWDSDDDEEFSRNEADKDNVKTTKQDKLSKKDMNELEFAKACEIIRTEMVRTGVTAFRPMQLLKEKNRDKVNPFRFWEHLLYSRHPNVFVKLIAKYAIAMLSSGITSTFSEVIFSFVQMFSSDRQSRCGVKRMNVRSFVRFNDGLFNPAENFPISDKTAKEDEAFLQDRCLAKTWEEVKEEYTLAAVEQPEQPAEDDKCDINRLMCPVCGFREKLFTLSCPGKRKTLLRWRWM